MFTDEMSGTCSGVDIQPGAVQILPELEQQAVIGDTGSDGKETRNKSNWSLGRAHAGTDGHFEVCRLLIGMAGIGIA